jgi:hypothetical protein
MHRSRRWLSFSSFLLAALAATSCAAVPYTYGVGEEEQKDLWAADPQITRGKPIAILDGLGHYVISLPSKLILWNWNVDRHRISPETEEWLRHYLEDNGMHKVKVRLNEYDPGDEFGRLYENDSVGWFWRYTLGLLTVTFYTILPGRLFGGDNYNPYTNTINIYSDDPAILLHEAGHAKDFALRKHKGTYAALRFLPLVPLYHEGVATSDAIGYLIDKEQRDEQKSAYKTLYPAYGTYVSGEGARWFALTYLEGLAVALAGAIPGHIAGRIAAARVEDEPAPAQPAPANGVER